MDTNVVWLQEMMQEVCLARGVRLLPEAIRVRLRERLRIYQTRALELL